MAFYVLITNLKARNITVFLLSLNVKRLLTQEEWAEFYMGRDSEFTYYIDMVEKKFAKSSTAPFDKRYDLLESVDNMFNKIRIRKE